MTLRVRRHLVNQLHNRSVFALPEKRHKREVKTGHATHIDVQPTGIGESAPSPRARDRASRPDPPRQPLCRSRRDYFPRNLGVGRSGKIVLNDVCEGNDPLTLVDANGMPFNAVHIERGLDRPASSHALSCGRGNEDAEQCFLARQQRHGIVPRLYRLGQGTLSGPARQGVRRRFGMAANQSSKRGSMQAGTGPCFPPAAAPTGPAP